MASAFSGICYGVVVGKTGRPVGVCPIEPVSAAAVAYRSRTNRLTGRTWTTVKEVDLWVVAGPKYGETTAKFRAGKTDLSGPSRRRHHSVEASAGPVLYAVRIVRHGVSLLLLALRLREVVFRHLVIRRRD